MAANRLTALLQRAYERYRNAWSLADTTTLVRQATSAGTPTERALTTLTEALLGGEISLSEYEAAVNEVFRRSGIDPALLVGVALAGASALVALRSDVAAPDAMRALQGEFNRRVTAVAEALATGRIDIDAWQAAMQAELRRYHLAAGVIGYGRSDAAAIALGSQRAAEQITYLNTWADELRDGRFPVDSASRLRQRARLYAGAGEATMMRGITRSSGMPDLPAYPKDHSTDCRHNCYCRWDIRQVGRADWDCFWRYDPARDNCKQCPRRARVWSPLRIRDGVIQPYDAAGLFRSGAARLSF